MRLTKKKKIAAIIVSILLIAATVVGIMMNAGATVYTCNDEGSWDGGYAYSKTITGPDSSGSYEVEIDVNNYKRIVDTEVVTYNPMDVVIILDASSSMAAYLSKEESSALSIIESLYTIGNTYTPDQMPNIAVVEFGESTIASENVNNTTSTALDWTTVTSSNYKSGGTIYSAITGLKHRAVSSSRLDLAIDRAGSLLSSKSSDGRDKFVIVFSDGTPTVSGVAFSTTERRSSTISKAASIKNQTYGSNSGNKAKIYSVIIGSTSISSSTIGMSAGEITMALVSSGTSADDADGNPIQYNYTEYTTSFTYFINSSGDPTWFCSYSKNSGLSNTQINSITDSLKTTSVKTTTTGGTEFNSDTVILDKVSSSYFIIDGDPKVYTESIQEDGDYSGTLTDITSSITGLTKTDSYVRLTGYDFEGTSVTSHTTTTKIKTYSGSRLIIKYKIKQNPNYVGDGGTFDSHLTSSNKNTSAYRPNDGIVSGIYANTSTTTPKYTLSSAPLDITANHDKGQLTIIFYGNGATSGSMANQTVDLSGTKSIKLNENQFVQKRTMVFRGNGSDEYPVSDQTVTKDAEFLGWATSLSDAEKNIAYYIPPDDGSGITYDLTSFYDSAEENPTVKLYACWGSPTAECPGMTRDTYSLLGFSTTQLADDPGTYVPYAEGDSVALQNLYNELWATWEKSEYTITYNYSANGGTSVSSETKRIAVGSAIDLTPTAKKEVSTYANTSWDFVGWSITSNSTVLVDKAYVPTGDTTVYAVYKTDLPVMVFYLNENGSPKYRIYSDVEDGTIYDTTIYNNETSKNYYDLVDSLQPDEIKSTDYAESMGFYDVIRADGESGYTVSSDADITSKVNVTVYTAGDTPDSVNSTTKAINCTEVVAFYCEYKVNATVTFDTDGGSDVASETAPVMLLAGLNNCQVINISTISLPSAPTKAGYLFKGWKVEGYDDILSAGDTIVVLKDTTVTAQYELNLFTVTYDYAENGGTSVDTATKSLTPGYAIDTTPVASKDGWTFLGWSLNKDSTTLITSADVMPKNNITVYAVYSKDITANFYTLDGKETKTGTIYNKETETTIACPSFNDNTSTDFSKGLTATSQYTDDITSASPALYNSVTISKDMDFFAVYKTNPVITYDTKDGTPVPADTVGTELTVFADSASEAVPSGSSSATLAEGSGIAKTGYIFSKWKIGEIEYDSGDTININKDTVMTAEWNPIHYTIAYDGNGASNGSIKSVTAAYDSAYKAADNAFYFDYTGSYFICWNTAPDGSGTDYYEGASLKNLTSTDGDTITLYARWLTAHITVSPLDRAYAPGKEVEYIISYTFPVDADNLVITDALPPAVKYNDSNVADWPIAHVDKNDVIVWSITAEINPVAAGTFVDNDASLIMDGYTTSFDTNTVRFTVNFSKVSYEGSGLDGESGSLPVDNTYYVSGDTTKAAESELKVQGYEFVGWENKADKTFYAEGDEITVNDNITLTAMFSKVEKTGKCSYIAPGETVIYTVKVTFPGDITTGEFTDNVPSELTVNSVSDTNLVIKGNTVSGKITAGSDGTYTCLINCTINSDVSTGATIQNKASVKYDAVNKTVDSNTDALSMGHKLTYVDSGEEFCDGKYYQTDENIIISGEKKKTDNDYFVKWCTTEDGTGTMYEEGDSITIESDTKLYAMKIHLEKKISDDTLQDDYIPGENIKYDIYVTVPYTIGMTTIKDIVPEGLNVGNFYMVTDSSSGESSSESGTSEAGEETPSEPDSGEKPEEEDPEEEDPENSFVVDPNGGYWEYEGKIYVNRVYFWQETFEEPSAAVRLGYTFDGWDKTVSGTETTYTAKWQVNTEGIPFVICVDPNGGTWTYKGVSYTEKVKTDLTDYSNLGKAVKDGFKFDGWTVSNELKTDSDGEIYQETTFTATWAEAGSSSGDSSGPIDISEDESGSGAEPEEQPKEYKIEFSAEAGKTYHFILEGTLNSNAPASTDKHEGGCVNYLVNTAELVFDGNTYTSNEVKAKIADYHTIKYAVVELDGKTPSGEVPVDPVGFYRHGETAEVLSADNLKMDGYSFIAWSTAKTRNAGSEYNAGDSIVLDTDVTLNAIFSESKDLPETGSIGIIVIAGVSIALVAAYIFLISRRKKDE